MTLRFTITMCMLLALLSCKKEDEPAVSLSSNELISGGSSASFHREISDSYDIMFNSVSQLSNGSYVICGNGGDGLFVVKSTTVGNIIWKLKKKLENNNSWSKKIIAQSDNEYVLTAGSGFSTRKTQPYFSWLYAIDNNGAALWEYRESNSDVLDKDYRDLILLDNNIISAGKEGYSDWYGNGFVQVFVKNELRSQLISISDSVNSIQSISKTSDGGLIVCGEFGNYPSDRMDLGIIKLNSSLTIEWKRRYKYTSTNESQNIREVEGGYIFSGEGIGMTKVDKNGDLIWSTNTSSTYIDVTTDGNIICVEGYFFKKVNSINGDLIWNTEFNAGKNPKLLEVHETNDLGFIAVGFVDDEGKRKGVIIKTDKDGN